MGAEFLEQLRPSFFEFGRVRSKTRQNQQKTINVVSPGIVARQIIGLDGERIVLYWFSVKRRLVENANALLPRVSVLV
jgi:hypothetical protein